MIVALTACQVEQLESIARHVVRVAAPSTADALEREPRAKTAASRSDSAPRSRRSREAMVG